MKFLNLFNKEVEEMNIFNEMGLGFLSTSEQLLIVERIIKNNFEDIENIITEFMIDREFGEGVE